MKKIVLIALFISLVINSMAQVKEKNQNILWKNLSYVVDVDAGLLVNNNAGYEQNIFSLDFVNSIFYKDFVGFGIGLGYEKFSMPHIPLYVDLKAIVPKWHVAPYVFIQSGYSFAFEDLQTYEDQQEIAKAKGGWLFNTGGGIAIKIHDGIAFTISIAYRYQELNYDLNNWIWWENYSVEQKNIYNRAVVKLGFQFN